MKNKFCDSNTLRNESDVEQFFIIKLLYDLGYSDKNILTKSHLKSYKIEKGKKKKEYIPDYVICLDTRGDKPVLVIDAKSPEQSSLDGVEDSQLYTSILRRNLKKPKPEQYCIGSNGKEFIVKEYESDDIKIKLDFEDFNDDNDKYKKLKQLLSKEKIEGFYKSGQKFEEGFEFKRPPRKEVNGIFRACHNLIWKKEKKKPTEAFYEFSKLFFVKLYYDRQLNKLFKEKGKLEPKDVFFSVRWIEEQEAVEKNPINTILFKNLRDELERQIREEKKKRILKPNEQLRLEPSTIKEVVRYLEHLNLFGIDEELNGRMFEQFLSATIRGKDLGQFFTPRTVVKFMTKMADIQVKDDYIDNILDAFCGSGGFLVEAMAQTFKKVDSMRAKSDIEKQRLKDKIVGNHLWGVDADKGELLPISKVARMNMYLYGDGSNRIYWLPDSLDKEMIIETTDEEIKREAEELKGFIKSGMKFDVILTNPPFSMKYEKKDKSEKRILEQYEISKNKGKLMASLNSNVLSIERYKDLLKPHGKYLTVIDESVLNTQTARKFRDFIKRHFIIRAVISLPRNTFVNQDTNVKTSILYLIKKEDETEKQPDIFMAISENVGHSDAGKEDLRKLDLYYEKDDDNKIINQEVKKTILDAYWEFIGK
ncbi:MAG: N-6 DNA methylase [Fusobacteriaceae bacterium]|nr:N-6 DNA methylase [Fusobacteriaceae bacterium]